MRTHHLLILGLLLPVTALALEISPGNFFTDVRLASREAAGINLLTRVGAVQGVTETRFVPTRPVNRAEFLKMALLSLPLDQRFVLTPGNCFPDVRSDDWFSPFVCGAKDAGLVSGNAETSLPAGQWRFDPQSTVQYDAALKILTKLYQYDIPSIVGADWGEPYYQAAVERGTDLPVTISFGNPLTRGKAARLIGGFLAESEGQLSAYRLAEAGVYDQSPAVPSSSSSSSSSVSASASLPSLPSSPSLYTIPSASHFLLIGTTSDAIADAAVPSRQEDAQAALVKVTLTREARSIDHLELRTASGELVALLEQRTTTGDPEYKQIYESSVTIPGTYLLKADTESRLVVLTAVRSTANNGFPNDLVQVRSINLTLRTIVTNQSINLPFLGPFPKHLTALGTVTSITSLSPSSGTLVSGTGQLLGSFSFEGSGVEARVPSLNSLTFTVRTTGQPSLSSALVRSPAGSVPCTINSESATISCPNLASQGVAFSLATPLIVTLTATITLPPGSTGGSVKVLLSDAGSPEQLGSIEWSDSAADFRWIDHSSPVATGIDLRQQ